MPRMSAKSEQFKLPKVYKATFMEHCNFRDKQLKAKTCVVQGEIHKKKCSQQDLPPSFFPWSLWTHDQTNVATICQFRRSGSTFRFLRISQLCTLPWIPISCH